ncbi:cilia- and flagella-associated protein 90-like [Diadema antillarum]|uniref:cilia- and flagella-associated protein 90-like n=1 Tax=Diadema antillarum TaxID=105358 RepID=UPI003A85432D
MSYPGEGKGMSNYGLSQQTPEQQKLLWVEIVGREQRIKGSHLAIKGEATGAWTGIKDQLPTPDQIAEGITYFNNNKKHEYNSTYDRLFHVKHGYQSKIHRDDREHTRGLNVFEEESNKAVPALTSSAYGHRPPIEMNTRQHARIERVMKGFYRTRGTNLPEYGIDSEHDHVL